MFSLPVGGASNGSPAEVRVDAERCFQLGDTVDHSHPPPAGVDRAMVVPTQGHAVVSVSGAALRVLDDAMDFAPLGTNPAARDDATTVTGRDAPALVGVEGSQRVAELDDPAVLGEDEALDASAARDLACDEAGDSGVRAVDETEPVVALKI